MLGCPVLHYWQQPIPTPLDAVRDDLPLADAHAFSIDEAGTFEVDDAFGVTPQEEARLSGFISPFLRWMINCLMRMFIKSSPYFCVFS
ncbi:MAG: hypothetical protein ACNYPH_04950 [Gammaproteobacteria bacterium WSBS_2016_MAG_OTU1]